MLIYLAGNTALPQREEKNIKKYKRRLVSYYYIEIEPIEKKVFYNVIKPVLEKRQNK